MTGRKHTSLLILCAFILIIVLYHLSGYFGHYGYDDMRYAGLAADLLNGKAHFDDNFTYRFPVVLLTALSYSLFGINDTASSLPALTVSVLILFIVFRLLKEKSPVELIAALALTTFSEWFIFYSDKLMPDIYIALSVILSLYVLSQYRYRRNSRIPTLFYSLAFVLALFLGFTSKESVILLAPLILFFIISDLIKKERVTFWLWSFAFGIVVLSLWAFVLWQLSGDLHRRFAALTADSYINLCRYDMQSPGVLLRRISYGLINLLVSHAMMPAFILILAALPVRKTITLLRPGDVSSFFTLSALILLLSSNFMSVSFTSYSPMCLDPRHYLFLLPVAAIPASAALQDFNRNRSRGILIVILLASVTLLSYFLQGKTSGRLYLPLTMLFVIYMFVNSSSVMNRAFVFLFAGILLIMPVHNAIYASKVNYPLQKEVVVSQILGREGNYYIITDEVQKRIADYLNGFRDNGKIFLVFDSFSFDTLDNRQKLLMLNRHTMSLSGIGYSDLPYYAKKNYPENRALYTHHSPDITLFELNNTADSAAAEKILLQSVNDFEGAFLRWYQNNKNLSEKVVYGDKWSQKPKEFSSTFIYPLDSLASAEITMLSVSCSMYCNYESGPDSELVISVEDDSGVYFREACDVGHYVKSFSTWWPVELECRINSAEIKKGSLLKVYLWNYRRSTVYIDNFEVTIASAEL